MFKKSLLLRTGIFISFIILVVLVSHIIFKPVRIMMITDNNYVLPATALINSIKTNKNFYTPVEINIIGIWLDETDALCLKQYESRNFKINIITKKRIEIKNASNGDFEFDADYFKFFITDLFPKYNKILYIDTDTVVLTDLSELWNTKLADNYVAAVDDMETTWNTPSDKRYFNNGVMLLNLKKMREDNLTTTRFIETKKKDKIRRFKTQDVFNELMVDKVVYLPLTYNTLAPEYDNNNILTVVKDVLKTNYDEKLYPYKTADEYRKNVKIIHFCGWDYLKPWIKDDPKRLSNNIWYNYVSYNLWLEKQITGDKN